MPHGAKKTKMTIIDGRFGFIMNLYIIVLPDYSTVKFDFISKSIAHTKQEIDEPLC